MADSQAQTAPAEPEIDFDEAMGAQAAEDAQKRYAGSGDRIPYFSLNDKETCLSRFLTDAFKPSDSDTNSGVFPYTVPWITVDQHSMVPTKAQPKDYSGNWPSTMGAVCRKDKVFKARYNDSCYIDENIKKKNNKGELKPNLGTPRTWALVVMREEVKGTKEMVEAGTIDASMIGKVLGIRDKMREVKKTDKDGKETGEVELVKDIRILNLGWKNFFASLQGMAGRYQTVLDRDFEITRKGSDTTTIYQITPLDPIDTKDPDDPDKVVRYDLRDPRFMVRYALESEGSIEDRLKTIPDIRKTIARMASDDYYNRFFVPGADGEDGASNGSSSSPATPSTDVADSDALAALKDRVAGYSPDAEATNAEAPADPPKGKKADSAKEPVAAASGGGMMDFG